METLLTFVIAGAVTLFFMQGYLKKLTAAKDQGVSRERGPRKERPCPRCGKTMEKASAFCPSCGAAMAMWTVHQAAEQKTSSGAPTGRPKPVINASLCIGCGSCVHACPEEGTLEMSGGKAILAHAERCTGHAKCSEVCPTQAITLSFGGVLQTLRVPRVSENFETNIPGVFIVGELCGMGLIKTAINEGKLVIDHLRQRLSDKTDGSREEEMYDVAIVGAGPAGLSASLTAQQCGLRYVTLEQGEIASTIKQYPRQKLLMAEPLEVPLYGALYVGDGSKEALLSVWETIIANTGVRINTNEKVESVQKNSAGFHVVTPKADYRARYVVLALGKRGTPRKLGVQGEDLPKIAYRLMEADSYEDKDILVVGGGDAAVEAALALSRAGKNRVVLSYRGDALRRVRERNREQVERAQQERRIRLLFNSTVERITDREVFLRVNDEAVTLPNDFVFVIIGG
jgi:thioredoxin reductase (NADPH)